MTLIPAARWRSRGAQQAVVALAVAVTLLVDPGPLGVLALLLVVVVPCERFWPRHPQPFWRPGLGTDLAYALLSGPFKAIGLVVALPVGLASLVWLPGLALRPLVLALPGPARAVLGFVLFDLVSYWAHRCMHRVPLLWRFHAVHHSSTRLDWVAGFRNHPLDGVVVAPAAVLLLAAGFGAEVTGALLVLQIVVGLYLHANVRWRLRPLHRVVATPEFHHWHHSDDAQAGDSNFSAFLPVWDVLFGTWFMPAGRRPTGYGIPEPMPDGVVPQLLHPLPPPRVLVRTAAGAVRHPVRSARSAVPHARVVGRQLVDAVRPVRGTSAP